MMQATIKAESKMATKTALIMAAGTGGHIFPGIAIARALEAHGFRIVWLATPEGMEHKLVGKVGYPIEVIAMSGVRAKGLLAWALLPARLLRAFWQSIAVIRRVKPQVVVSMGGYIAFPGGMMAVLLGKPLVVHEPGAHAGLTNRVLALIADRVLVGFPTAFAEKPKNTIAAALPKPKKIEWLGTPIREDITNLVSPEVRMSSHNGPIRLLIVGGSLGAKTMSELVVSALKLIPDEKRPQVIHQSGDKNFDELVAFYKAANVDADVRAFIDDMAAMYEWCDVLICRSGAITVAEVAAVGIASILVPLPWFVAEEQMANALFLSEKGAGLLVKQNDETPEMLSQKIISIDRAKAMEMAKIARGLGKPNATAACANACMEVALAA
jgi:UDP-N-acetylglucosamine--N-acetylmuramyl-(pentapeptide) pyrophosphoryl-undecaprenol N-acetylglucosamine transferase